MTSIRTDLSVRGEADRKAAWGDSMRLDEDGRGTLEVYGLLTHLELAVRSFPAGPGRTLRIDAPTPALLQREREIALPAACSMTAQLVDDQGAPVAELFVHVTARYDDGEADSGSARTDAQGRLRLDGSLRASAEARLHVRVHGVGGAETTLPATPAGGVAELRTLTLE